MPSVFSKEQINSLFENGFVVIRIFDGQELEAQQFKFKETVANLPELKEGATQPCNGRQVEFLRYTAYR